MSLYLCLCYTKTSQKHSILHHPHNQVIIDKQITRTKESRCIHMLLLTLVPVSFYCIKRSCVKSRFGQYPTSIMCYKNESETHVQQIKSLCISLMLFDALESWLIGHHIVRDQCHLHKAMAHKEASLIFVILSLNKVLSW